MAEPVIRVEGLSKAFGNLSVLENVNLEVRAGEKIAIIGGSGCGKSVFLRCIEYLIKPDSGKVFINGKDICAKGADVDGIHREIGMVYQQFNLFEHMDVMDNLCLAPTKLLNMPRAEAEEKARRLLKEVGLAGREHSWPKNMSGGQKQRVAIARCLMMNPKIMLMDEPTSALDPTMVGEVRATIRALGKKGMTMLIVTHEMDFAKTFADRILFLADKGIYEDGTPEQIFDRPQKEKTKQFIHKVKQFAYHVSAGQFDLMELQGRIATFCERYGQDSKRSWRFQLCTEEMVGLILEKESEIELVGQYSEADQMISLQCIWEGTLYNPLEDAENAYNLGVCILKKTASSLEHRYENGKNTVTFMLSDKK